MDWANILYAASIIATVVVSGGIALYSAMRRDVPGARPFAGFSAFIGFMALFEGLSATSAGIEWALFWFNARHLSLALMPVFWLLFVLEYTGNHRLIPKTGQAALFIIPALTQVMIWTNASHGLWVKKQVGFLHQGSFLIADLSQRIYGPWTWVHLGYSYLLTLAGLIVLCFAALRANRRDRGQIRAVGIGTLVMTVVSILPVLALPRGFPFNLLVSGLAAGLAIIFYGAYRHRFLRSPLVFPEAHKTPLMLIFLFVALAFGISAAGYSYYQHYEKNYRIEVESLLSSIAELKVAEIVQWRKERLADASVLHGHENFTHLARRVFTHPSDTDAQRDMRLRLDKLRRAYAYRNLLLLDAGGRLRLSAADEASDQAVCEEVTRHLALIRKTGKPFFLDFHREQGTTIMLSVLVPLMVQNHTSGFVVMVIDPHIYLYPAIQRWPTPAKTAETLLVRRAGNRVEFLNELKFQKDTALRLSFPLSRSDLPAARAAMGEEGVMEGIDYRGKNVIAALKTIPDSPWFMVARMDKEEIYAPLRTRLWLLIATIGVCIVAAGLIVIFFWQRQTTRHALHEVETARALQASEEKFRKAFMTSPDIIAMIRWRDGQIISVNPGFLEITGYTREEAEGSVISELPIWTDPADRLKLVQNLKDCKETTNEEIRFRRKDGKSFFGLVSSSVLELGGEPHILSITRDITERKTAEEALARTHERLQRFLDSNIVGIIIAAADGKVLEANDYYLNMIGCSREELHNGVIDWRSFTPAEWLEADETAISQVRQTGVSAPYEKQYIRRDGVRVDILLAVTRLPGEEEQLAAFVLDITERKKIEREVSLLNEELEARVEERTAEIVAKNEQLEHLNRVFVDRELRMRELKDRISELEKKA